jgi:hypothetical protein
MGTASLTSRAVRVDGDDGVFDSGQFADLLFAGVPRVMHGDAACTTTRVLRVTSQFLVFAIVDEVVALETEDVTRFQRDSSTTIQP